MATDLMVANTILDQLGGRHFLTMCGIRRETVLGGENYLRFRLPRGSAKNKATIVTVTLNQRDFYDVAFQRLTRSNEVVDISEHTDIPAENLRSLFTHETGLLTKLF